MYLDLQFLYRMNIESAVIELSGYTGVVDSYTDLTTNSNVYATQLLSSPHDDLKILVTSTNHITIPTIPSVHYSQQPQPRNPRQPHLYLLHPQTPSPQIHPNQTTHVGYTLKQNPLTICGTNSKF
jgi:hypothetical protein